MPKFISCREFLRKKQKQKKYQNCLVRIFDCDEYEHITFKLREDTDFDSFNNVFDQELLDSVCFSHFIINDEDGISIFIYGDVEL